ncbi:cupin domain-containing protein [Psychromonas hadalis]|uniref:cupin domain-containing protein n=1 Tax=Psychromonas hadalis TaxID=211669 RepID=UPI0003B57FB3|nr:cupin domain-containing protein [Psychromonas hadalis]
MFEYTLFNDLAEEVDIPKAGITSHSVYKSGRLKAVIFGFAEGEEMSEHTASVPAIIQILKGNATLTFESEIREVSAGAWVHMDARLPHSVIAKTPLVIMVYLLREPK